MFILTMKPLKHKKIVLSAIIFLASASLLLLLSKCTGDNKEDTSNLKASEYNVCVKSNEARVEFLACFGWKVQPEPLEVCEVTIPAKFNETFEKYNNIQKEQGFDLSKYKERSCTRYTYQLLNYKDAPGGIRANMLVLDNKIIAGDISSIELGGFMHGFSLPENADSSEITYNTYVTNKVNAKPKNSPPLPIQTTYRESLKPDENMPNAPTD